MSEELYGIDINHAHPKAVALIPQDFFWNAADELAPFGSDEGDTALSEYREWRKQNPGTPTIECLKWVIEDLGEMELNDYNNELLDREKIESAITNNEFDDQYYIFTLDTTVIASGFGQLVDEGIIETANKPFIQTAIDRLIIWTELQPDWKHGAAYITNLRVLRDALETA